MAKKYKNPILTVDAILPHPNNDRKILMVNRGIEPFKGMWALPGGHVEYGESTPDAVLRELSEETGIEAIISGLLGVFSSPDRDPRGHRVSIVYVVSMDARYLDNIRSGDDASSVGWFSVDTKTQFAFDHNRIVDLYRKKLVDVGIFRQMIGLSWEN